MGMNSASVRNDGAGGGGVGGRRGNGVGTGPMGGGYPSGMDVSMGQRIDKGMVHGMGMRPGLEQDSMLDYGDSGGLNLRPHSLSQSQSHFTGHRAYGTEYADQQGLDGIGVMGSSNAGLSGGGSSPSKSSLVPEAIPGNTQRLAK